MFIVIEGDNGTGKTTLGKFLQRSGFVIVNDTEEAKILEAQAKTYPPDSLQRYEAFLKYNRLCGEYARKSENAAAVRYWFSTITAAFADGIFTSEEALNISEHLNVSMIRPDYIFRLYCDYPVRTERILRRASRSTGNLSDDVSIERSIKYRQFSDVLVQRFGNCYNIDTTASKPSQMFTKIAKIARIKSL
ncbi:MAG: hypothetical protein IJS39_07065 [Synergistaceae bacterium]|nr:hypothetical protein [Synergistaceae bacterium]